MSAPEHCGAHGHEVCDAMVAIPDQFVQDAGDEGECLCVVEAHAAGEALLGEEAGLRYDELVDLVRSVGLRAVDECLGRCGLTSLGANCMLTVFLRWVLQHGNH